MQQLVQLLPSILHHVFRDICLHCKQNVLQLCHVEDSPYRAVLYAILVSLYLASLFPKDQTVIIEVIKGFVLLLAEPTEWSIFRDYYAIHIVQIVVPCCGMYKKCHITSAEPRNYLPYPTVWSIIK